jgi:uncharacterized protein (TIGR00251 family)
MSVRIAATQDGVRVWVKVVPGSSRDRIVGPLGDALKIAVSKPPSGGAANAAVVALLAAALGISAKQVHIESGQSNARKQVLVRGIDLATLRARLHLEE